jgi:hypothetical protein
MQPDIVGLLFKQATLDQQRAYDLLRQEAQNLNEELKFARGFIIELEGRIQRLEESNGNS